MSDRYFSVELITCQARWSQAHRDVMMHTAPQNFGPIVPQGIMLVDSVADIRDISRMLPDFMNSATEVVLALMDATNHDPILGLKIYAPRLWPYPYHTHVPWRVVADPYIRDIGDPEEMLKAIVNDLINRPSLPIVRTK